MNEPADRTNHFVWQASLRGRIGLAYGAIAILTIALAAFAFVELRALEGRILLGERVAELFDTALEIRRYERNLFLYGEEADYRENAANCARLTELIDANQADFLTLGLGTSLPVLHREITAYQRLMADFSAAGSHDQERRRELESRIRASGKAIVASSEAVVVAERQAVRTSLSALQAMLFFSVVAVILVMVAVGRILSQRVAQPLKQIEASVKAVAAGRRREIALAGQDREIVSIAAAFNQMLKELELRNRHLLRSEKLASIGTMVAGVAHELNNPLSNIWSSCQILLEDPALAAESPQRDMLRQIDAQSIRARNIVRSLLDFTRDRQFRSEQVLLADLLRQSLAFLKGDISAGLVVALDIPASLAVMADRSRLQQAFLNLIKNAIEASAGCPSPRLDIRAAPGSGETLAPTLRDGARDDFESTLADDLTACAGRPMIDVLIRDNGAGMAAELLPRIFDPFFTTKDVGKGMGLGLFITYQIVEEHGGCIAVASASGRGTTFALRLPAAENI